MRYVVVLLLLLFSVQCTNTPQKGDEIVGECGHQDPIHIEDLELEFNPDSINVDTSIVIPIMYHFMYPDSFNFLLDEQYDLESLDIVHARLNDAFQGRIKFDRDTSDLHHIFPHTLVELYDDFRYGTGDLYNDMIKEYTVEGYYNIFIIKTSAGFDRTLLGFTPVFVNGFDGYEWISPEFDNAAVSYIGLFDYEVGSTVIHETGHWLSLAHPFELTPEEKEELGLDTKYDICLNFMNYNCFVSEFTDEQLDLMVAFAKQFRHYLIKSDRE